MSEILKRIEFKRNLPEYLVEVSILAGEDVDAESLSSLEEVDKIRQNASTLANAKSANFTIPFEERGNKRFKEFISSLYASNGRPVYIWTNRTTFCGLYKVPSIKAINFSFPFNINSEGILTFVTDDCHDRLLLDFSHDSAEREILEVETQGRHWPSVSY